MCTHFSRCAKRGRWPGSSSRSPLCTPGRRRARTPAARPAQWPADHMRKAKEMVLRKENKANKVSFSEDLTSRRQQRPHSKLFTCRLSARSQEDALKPSRSTMPVTSEPVRDSNAWPIRCLPTCPSSLSKLIDPPTRCFRLQTPLLEAFQSAFDIRLPLLSVEFPVSGLQLLHFSFQACHLLHQGPQHALGILLGLTLRLPLRLQSSSAFLTAHGHSGAKRDPLVRLDLGCEEEA